MNQPFGSKYKLEMLLKIRKRKNKQYNYINRRARLSPMMLNEQNHKMLKWRWPLHHYIDFDAIKANRKLKRNKNILLSRAFRTYPICTLELRYFWIIEYVRHDLISTSDL